MDAIAKLRHQARARRDVAFALARAEYRRALRNIRFLATDDDDETEYGATEGLIVELIPSRPFGLYEMAVWLREAAPANPIRVSSIRTLIYRLVRRGVLRAVAKDHDGKTLWAGVESEADRRPLGALGMPDAVAVVLGDAGPLREIEITVALQDRGYRTYLKDRELYAAVREALRRYPGRFECGKGGQWAASAVPCES